MTAEQMWTLYGACGSYEAWQYGCAPDELAELTLSGIKHATASAYPVYVAEAALPPKPGDHSVILDSKNEAVCIIRTTRVRVIHFKDVPADFASAEGEGDGSLRYWRNAHESYFLSELKAIGQVFTEEMPVVCEEFEVVYP